MIEAIIFDMDGVLVDTRADWENVRRDLMAAYGYAWSAADRERVEGANTREWSTYMARCIGQRLSAEQIAETVVARLAALYAERLPLLPGAAEAVRWASGQWLTGLASGSPRQLIESIVEAAGLRPGLRVLVSADEVAAGKPEPDVYLEAARRLGVPPARAVCVEDSAAGIQAGVRAGMRVIAVPHPAFPLPPAALEAATLVVNSLAELTPLAITQLR